MPLIIKNFQSHIDSTFDFEEGGVNVIVGPSRVGKSAVFRALESVALNESVERRSNTPKTKVSWRGVSRVRSNSDNMYLIGDTEYKAMRTAVPKQVSDKLRISEVNFRPQHKAYFLLQDSPGAVARAMNELTDLGVIDYVASKLKTEEATRKEALDGILIAIDTEEKAVLATEWAVEADNLLSEFEEVEKRTEAKRKSLQELDLLLGAILVIDESLDHLPSFDLALIDTAIVALDMTGLTKLSQVLSTLAACDKSLLGLGGLNDSVNKIDLYLEAIIDNDCAALSDLLDLVAEYDRDLADCPDATPWIEQIESFCMPGAFSALTVLLDQIEGLVVPPDPSQALQEIYALGESWPAPFSTKELRAIEAIGQEMLGCEAELAVASKAFKKELRDAGECPLCGGSTR